MASMLGVLMKNERAQKETNDRVLLQTNESENPFFFFEKMILRRDLN